MRAAAVCFVVVGLAAFAAGSVAADTAPIPDTPSLPWTNPAHRSTLELLLGSIASHIAGRDVTVRCEGETDWSKLTAESRGDPDAELGYVRGMTYDRTTGQLLTLPNFMELNGTKVCLPLQEFAVATTKPTKCSVATHAAPTPVTVRVRVMRDVNGRVEPVWSTKTLTRPGKVTLGPPVPCYLGGTNVAQVMTTAYWKDYSTTTEALLTVAHEAIHLSGVVGTRFSNGVLAGDQQAEAKATCFGMQWIPWVAQELGDTADDGLAIAEYYWEQLYPQIENSSIAQYWSADCVPGGAMDMRPAGSTDWP